MESKRTIEEVLDLETGHFINAYQFFDSDEKYIWEIRRRLEDAIKGYKDPKFVCFYCKQLLKIKGRPSGKGETSARKTLFFAHLKDSDDCNIKTNNALSKAEINRIKYNGAKESWAHKQTKNLIGELLALNEEQGLGISDIDIDKYYIAQKITGERRRPDVICQWNDHKLVFEIQLSTTFLSVIAEREHFYREENAFIVWVFKEFNLDEDLQRFTEKDILYTNKQNVFVLDDDAIAESYKNSQLTLKCFYKKYSRNGYSTSSSWQSTFVTLDTLTKDEEEKKLYYYDPEKDLKKILFELEQDRIMEEEAARTVYAATTQPNIETPESDDVMHWEPVLKRKRRVSKKKYLVESFTSRPGSRSEEDDIYRLFTDGLTTRTRLIQIFILNDSEILSQIKDLFLEGYVATDFDKQHLGDCFTGALLKVESETWNKFATNLAIAILLIKINNKNAITDFFRLYEALLAIVCIKSDTIFHFEITSFSELAIFIVDTYPWSYRFIKNALLKYQNQRITAADLEALYARFTFSLTSPNNDASRNYNYLIQSAFPEL